MGKNKKTQKLASTRKNNRARRGRDEASQQQDQPPELDPVAAFEDYVRLRNMAGRGDAVGTVEQEDIDGGGVEVIRGSRSLSLVSVVVLVLSLIVNIRLASMVGFVQIWSYVAATAGIVANISLFYAVRRLAKLGRTRGAFWTQSGVLVLIVFGYAYMYFANDGCFIDSTYGPSFQGAIPAPSFSDCLYFSLVTSSSLGYGDIYPASHFRLVVASEAVLGYLHLGMLVSLFLTYQARKKFVKCPVGHLVPNPEDADQDDAEQ